MLAVNPEQAPVVREMFDLCVSGLGFAGIAGTLDSADLKLVNRKLTEWRQQAEALRSEIAVVEAQTAQEHDPEEMAQEAVAYRDHG